MGEIKREKIEWEKSIQEVYEQESFEFLLTTKRLIEHEVMMPKH
jgi:hypothetical protein